MKSLIMKVVEKMEIGFSVNAIAMDLHKKGYSYLEINEIFDEAKRIKWERSK